MSKINPMPSAAFDARALGLLDDAEPVASCIWRDCDGSPIAGLPLCHGHAMKVTRVMLDAATRPSEEEREPYREVKRDGFVYYLRIGPRVVKIGTTTNLRKRLGQHRASVRDVIAIERGSYGTEHARHTIFAADRIGSREHFRMSPALRALVIELQPRRDELLRAALS